MADVTKNLIGVWLEQNLAAVPEDVGAHDVHFPSWVTEERSDATHDSMERMLACTTSGGYGPLPTLAHAEMGMCGAHSAWSLGRLRCSRSWRNAVLKVAA